MLEPKARLNANMFNDDVEQIPIRKGFGEGLVQAAEKDKRIVGLCADLTESTQMHLFKNRFPERFIEIGVAEQNLAAVASGLAASGKIPFISSYAVFSPGRNWEQIRTTICYNNQKVVIIGSHGGVSVGPDGGSHQALEDLAIMRVLPRMTVLSPFEIGKAQIFAKSRIENPESRIKVGIIATGTLTYRALKAAKELEGEGISVDVLNLSTIKPIDKEAIISLAKKTGAIVTVEAHQIAGGM